MRNESDLRNRLREPGPEGEIDVAEVLRRARARRRPRVALATAIGTFALVGILVPVSVVALGTAQNGALFAVEDQAAAPEAAAGADGDEELTGTGLHRCGGQLAEPVRDESGLVIEVDPVAAAATEGRIPVVVTLRNTGAETIRGRTWGAPEIALARGGVVLWHSDGPSASSAAEVELAPGEERRFDASFSPVVCSETDDLDGFRDDLPPAGPGTYVVLATIEFVGSDGRRSVLTSAGTAVLE